MENRDGKVAERVSKKLRVEPPGEELVMGYLVEIASTYGVDWPKKGGGDETKDEGAADNDDDDDEDQPGSGGQAVKNLEPPLTTDELSKATPPRDLGPRSPVSVAPPSPSTDNLSPRVKLPGPPDLKPGAKIGGGLKKQTSGTAAQSEAKEGEGGKAKGAVGGQMPDVDELQRRLAEWKRRG